MRMHRLRSRYGNDDCWSTVTEVGIGKEMMNAMRPRPVLDYVDGMKGQSGSYRMWHTELDCDGLSDLRSRHLRHLCWNEDATRMARLEKFSCWTKRKHRPCH